MKLATFIPPFEGALNKHHGIYLSILGLIIATLWNTHSVSAAPAKLDSLASTFPLDLQPPIFEATLSSASPQANGDVTTIDSYGNPIESLQPIETPDGRKVVSAQGLQFEIPNYASGITELKKPADDLLPPFIAPFDTVAANDGNQTKEPLSADRESFPPFNNVISGSSSTIPSKTTFSKSEDGKVITNNVFLSGGIGSTSDKPTGSAQTLNSQEKNVFTTQAFSGSTFTKASSASSVFKQFGTPSAAASGFATVPGTTNTNGGSQYTGRFGGPPGILAPLNSGFSTASATVTKTYNNPATTTFGVTSSPGSTANIKDKFTGSFGGPPGVLKPYDTVKNR